MRGFRPDRRNGVGPRQGIDTNFRQRIHTPKDLVEMEQARDRALTPFESYYFPIVDDGGRNGVGPRQGIDTRICYLCLCFLNIV